MKSILFKKISSMSLILLVAFLFTNTVRTDNSTNFESVGFGPSPIAMDGRSLFDIVPLISGGRDGEVVGERMRYDSFWRNLKTKTDTITIHPLLLDSFGDYNASEKSPELIALTDEQIRGIYHLQTRFGFKVVVNTGMGLGKFCNPRISGVNRGSLLPDSAKVISRSWQKTNLAREAASLDFRHIERLTSAGVRIHAVNVDGPFLRNIVGSNKAESCDGPLVEGVPENRRGRGFLLEDSIEIGAKYFSRLRVKIAEAQSNEFPIMNWTINLPNLNIGSNDSAEIAINGSDVNIGDLIRAFNNSIYRPNIGELVLDYPYHYIRQDRQTFANKLHMLNSLADDMRESPRISFFVNTETINLANADCTRPHYSGYRRGCYCLKNGIEGKRDSTKPIFLTFNNNSCFTTRTQSVVDNARALINREDRAYLSQVREHYNILNYGLSSGIRKGSLYFSSWHPFPSRMENLGEGITDTLRDNTSPDSITYIRPSSR